VLCCKTFVPLSDDEYQAYQWEWNVIAGRILIGLKRRPNGDCVYLREGGCAIHDAAPRVCRAFDCRDPSIARRQGIPPEIIERGRELNQLKSKESVSSPNA